MYSLPNMPFPLELFVSECSEKTLVLQIIAEEQ